MNQQVALTARLGAPGVLAAYCSGYPSCNEIKLWNVKGGEALTVAKVDAGRQAWIAAAPEGRVWVMWGDGHAPFAVRSNKAATRFGRVHALGMPAGASTLHHTLGEGSAGPLDAIVHVAADRDLASHHKRVYPELALAPTEAGVLVTDVGDPVEGVEVTVDGKAVKTDANGIAALSLTPGKATPAKAAHPGYAPWSGTIALPVRK